MDPRRSLTPLVVAALLLPIVICAAVGVARLLAALGDAAGAMALDYVALGVAMLWGIALVALVVVLAIDAIGRGDEPRDE